MTLKETLNKAYLLSDDLKVRTNLKWLLVEMLDLTPTEYLLNENMVLEEPIINRYLDNVEKHLNENVPVQYLINRAYFYNDLYYVNEHVLIPRKETEELVYKVSFLIKEHFNNSNLKILDLGTGSGVIGITLKKMFPESEITLSDINNYALEVAKINAHKNNVDVNFILSDWFDDINNKYDVVISNPPYIKSGYQLEGQVLKEPKEALYSGSEGLDSYQKILKDIQKHLNRKYLIAFEHGYDQKESLKVLLKEYFNDDEISQEKDLQKNDRMTFILSRDENEQ